MTFIVKDLEHSSQFFEKIFDAKEVYASEDDTFYYETPLWMREDAKSLP